MTTRRVQEGLDLLFLRARHLRQHRHHDLAAHTVEPAGSEDRPGQQVPHPWDYAVEALAHFLSMEPLGSTGVSLRTYGPLDGWPADKAEDMRLTRVKLGMERPRKGDVYTPLFGEPYPLD